MIGHSELARILMAISNDEELVKNTLSKLAKQFEIKYGEFAENEEKDPDHKIKVGLLYDSIVTSSPIVVNDGNFRQIIKERSDKGTHLMLYDRIIADSVIDYYELVFVPIAFGENCYLCLVSPKDNLDDAADDSVDDRIDRVFRQINTLKSKSSENAKKIIKVYLNDWKKMGLIDNSYKIKSRNKPQEVVNKIYNLFNDLNYSLSSDDFIHFIELLFDDKIEENKKGSWRSAINRGNPTTKTKSKK